MKHLHELESIALLKSIVLACLAVALAVIAVISGVGPTWAWISLAAIAAGSASALLRVATEAART